MLRCYARAHAIVTKTKDLGDIEQTYWTDKVFEVVKGIMDRRDASGA